MRGGKGKQIDVYDMDGTLFKSFPSVKRVAAYFGVNHSNVLYWLRTGVEKNGYTFRFHDEADNTPYTPYHCYKTKPPKDELPSHGHFKTFDYEVKNVRVSITPCPYKRYPKPMIGSGACQKCSSFRGIDRKLHKVACSHR